MPCDPTPPKTDPPAENVISLTTVLAKKYKPRECLHDHIEIDDRNRRVTCADCKREIEPFLALSRIADRASEWQLRWDAMRKDWRNLAGYVPHLRAVRDLESMWRGNRLPMCPHCKKGVTADGLNKMGWVNKRYAEAVEQHARETAPVVEPIALHGEPTDAE